MEMGAMTEGRERTSSGKEDRRARYATALIRWDRGGVAVGGAEKADLWGSSGRQVMGSDSSKKSGFTKAHDNTHTHEPKHRKTDRETGTKTAGTQTYTHACTNTRTQTNTCTRTRVTHIHVHKLQEQGPAYAPKECLNNTYMHTHTHAFMHGEVPGKYMFALPSV